MSNTGQGQPQGQTQPVQSTGQQAYPQTQQGQGWVYPQQPQAANIGVQAGDTNATGRRPAGPEAMYPTDINFNDLSAAEPALPPTGRSKFGTT